MAEKLGILAYGSLIDDPGGELKAATDRVWTGGIITPFNVEFARSAATRGGAPTLVPVENGGAPVAARIFVLKSHVSLKDAENILWRRETRRATGEYNEDAKPGLYKIKIEKIHDFHKIGIVLYTRIAPNIRPLTPDRLAELALSSARSCTVPEGRDGISYLIAALKNGISTPLSTAYEQAVKRQAGTTSLAEARELMLRHRSPLCP